MKKPFAHPAGHHFSLRGFSLVELLMVIVIMTILMTMGAMGIRNLAGGKGTSTAIANAEAVFAEARATAIGRSAGARVMIDAKSIDDPNNYLRRMVIAAQDVDATTGLPVNTWGLISRGYTMPDGTFYSVDLSKKDGAGSTSMAPESVTLNKTADSGNYIVYEFNGQGICITPGATFVLGSGIRQKGAAPMVTGSAKRDFAGFTIWGNGETSTFRNPDQIGDLSTIKNF